LSLYLSISLYNTGFSLGIARSSCREVQGWTGKKKKIKTRNERQERLERENLSLRSAWQTITDTKRQKTSARAK